MYVLEMLSNTMQIQIDFFLIWKETIHYPIFKIGRKYSDAYNLLIIYTWEI